MGRQIQRAALILAVLCAPAAVCRAAPVTVTPLDRGRWDIPPAALRGVDERLQAVFSSIEAPGGARIAVCRIEDFLLKSGSSGGYTCTIVVSFAFLDKDGAEVGDAIVLDESRSSIEEDMAVVEAIEAVIAGLAERLRRLSGARQDIPLVSFILGLIVSPQIPYGEAAVLPGLRVYFMDQTEGFRPFLEMDVPAWLLLGQGTGFPITVLAGCELGFPLGAFRVAPTMAAGIVGRIGLGSGQAPWLTHWGWTAGLAAALPLGGQWEPSVQIGWSEWYGFAGQSYGGALISVGVEFGG